MNIIFWGKGNRGISCLKKLIENNIEPCLIVTDPNENNQWYGSVSKLSKELQIQTISPDNPNDRKTEKILSKSNPDLFILAGYGRILKKRIFDIPNIMTINLHGGKLPEYRGSSPMNWSLINGEKNFSISIIKMDEGVDTGDILHQKSFDIGINDTISDLHSIANKHFPLMLVDVIHQLQNNSFSLSSQDEKLASYYPLRFPDDGLIMWDYLTAEEVHNRIRALTDPYPGAFSYYQNKKVKLLQSRIPKIDYFGEPGRIYKIDKDKGMYICAKDKCVLITKAVIFDSNEEIIGHLNKYDKFATMHDLVKNTFEEKVLHDN